MDKSAPGFPHFSVILCIFVPSLGISLQVWLTSESHAELWMCVRVVFLLLLSVLSIPATHPETIFIFTDAISPEFNRREMKTLSAHERLINTSNIKELRYCSVVQFNIFLSFWHRRKLRLPTVPSLVQVTALPKTNVSRNATFVFSACACFIWILHI